MPTNVSSGSSYAEICRLAMKTTNNPSKRPLSLRDLEKATGYSYEQCRKVIAGQPVLSSRLNKALCRVLGLDARKMWALAIREKKRRTLKRLGSSPLADTDVRLASVWRDLSTTERDAICAMAADLVRKNDVREPSCYVVTVRRDLLVVAESDGAARQKVRELAVGGRISSVSKLADAVVAGHSQLATEGASR